MAIIDEQEDNVIFHNNIFLLKSSIFKLVYYHNLIYINLLRKLSVDFYTGAWSTK